MNAPTARAGDERRAGKGQCHGPAAVGGRSLADHGHAGCGSGGHEDAERPQAQTECRPVIPGCVEGGPPQRLGQLTKAKEQEDRREPRQRGPHERADQAPHECRPHDTAV